MAPGCAEGLVSLLGEGPGNFFLNTCAISCILAIVSPFISSVFLCFHINWDRFTVVFIFMS